MMHPCNDVERALVQLNDALCMWERSTGRESVLILREQGGYAFRSNNGKPGIPDDIPDAQLLAMVAGPKEVLGEGD